MPTPNEFLVPLQPLHEAQSRQTFLALMWSLSYPLTPQPFTGGMASVAHALLDLEATYFSDDDALANQLARTHARETTINQAQYIFFSRLHQANLHLVEQANIGDWVHPDHGATLIIGCGFDTPVTELTGTGPGINGVQHAGIAGIPNAFWLLREQRIRYPLGFDCFLVSQTHVLGLPRTTKISVS